jgi:hypothetical protein|tara:strand:+ start:6108 stop:7124 length:1017 start_codon:yes stop_codon:yes gene_type:complete
MFRKIILSVLIVAVLSCCSSEVSGEKNNDDGLLPGVPSQASKSNDFLSQGDFSTDPDLYNLSESQMSCLVDQLLNFFSPEQVSAITSEGPNVEQKEVALSALELCDLLVTVVNLGIFEGIANSFETFPNDTDCVLSTIREKELVPIFEILLSEIDSAEMSEKIEEILLESRILDFLVTCVLDAKFGHYQNNDPVCSGLFDRVAKMMTAIIRQGIQVEEGPTVNPKLLIELFSISDEIYIWLAKNVDIAITEDASIVRDASIYVSNVMIDSFRDLGSDAKPEEVLEAMFVAVIRLDTELAEERKSINQAQERLEQYLVSVCGDSATYLFNLLSGIGQKI